MKRLLVGLMLFGAASAAVLAQDQQPAPTAAEATDSPAQTASPAVDTSAAQRVDRPAGAARVGADRLDLDTTVVTGNRELPKVLYIVPWKKAELGELPAQPFNTLLDEALTPVDRDEFRREVTYYEAVTRSTDATQSTSVESH